MEYNDYSKEELEKLLLYNTAVQGLNNHDAEKSHRDAMNALLLEQATNNTKISQSYLAMSREGMRPHKLYPTDVYWSPQDSKFICRLHFMEMDEEVDGISIFAYGDTPAEACDNFDHQWIHGNQDD